MYHDGKSPRGKLLDLVLVKFLRNVKVFAEDLSKKGQGQRHIVLFELLGDKERNFCPLTFSGVYILQKEADFVLSILGVLLGRIPGF